MKKRNPQPSKSTALTKSPNTLAKPGNGNIFPTDQDGQIIPGTYNTAVGEVKVKKIIPATHYDVINVAKAMNEDEFAPRLKELFDPEQEACQEALRTGFYVSYRPADSPYDQQDCIRVSSKGRCFCSHLLMEHQPFTGRENVLKCKQSGCECKAFAWIPSRPEESGEFWLRKRRDFVPSEYRAKCRCKHTHEQHKANPPPHRCTVSGCGCSMFSSAFVCAACDMHWHRHRTVFETTAERKAAGRPVGEEWLPFAELPDLRDIALTGVDNPGVNTLQDALPLNLRNRIDQKPTNTDSGAPVIIKSKDYKSGFRPTYD